MRLASRGLSASRLAAACVMTAVLGVPVPTLAQQSPPSLGEIARQEAERRKELAAATRVYTKDDLPKTATLPPATNPASTPASASASQPKDATTAAGEKGDKEDAAAGNAQDEAWWRDRITQPREAIRRNEMFLQALQTRINSLAADFASRDDPRQRAQIAEDRTKALAELELLSKEIKALHAQIADIENEARRLGVPPGWLR